MACLGFGEDGSPFIINRSNGIAMSKVEIAAPTKPSTVFFGDRRGNNFLDPIETPKKYAIESLIITRRDG